MICTSGSQCLVVGDPQKSKKIQLANPMLVIKKKDFSTHSKLVQPSVEKHCARSFLQTLDIKFSLLLSSV